MTAAKSAGLRVGKTTAGKPFSLPVDVAGEAIGVLATRGAGKSYSAAVLVEELHAAGIPVVVVDPTGVFWGLRSGADGKSGALPIFVLGGPHGDVPLEATAGALIADLVVDSYQSFVIDLSDFPTKGDQTRFMTAFAERLYRRKARARTTLHLIIDEADEFAPQRPMPKEAQMLGAMEALVRRGRSRGLGSTLITQRSAALNKNVLDLIETLIVLRTLGPRDRNAIEGWVSAKELRDELGVLESLPSLPTGTGWVWSPVRDVLEKVAVRRIRTFDSYATPKPGQKRVEPAARFPINVEKLGEQIRATVERAKENDPKALKRRIAELEAGTRKGQQEAPAPDPSATQRQVEREVARAVATAEKPLQARVGRLETVIDRARGASEKLVEAAQKLLQVLEVPVENGAGAAPPRRAPRPEPVRVAHRAIREPAIPREIEPVEGVSRPQQRILQALVSLEALGIDRVARGNVAVFSDASPRSSAYTNNLGRLSTMGLIQYPAKGAVSITEVGREVAGAPEAIGSVDELHAAWRRKLPRPQGRILDVLVEIYPKAITREDLAHAAGASPTSSTYTNNPGRLSSLGLLRYPARGEVVATELLFPPGLA